MKFRNLFSRGKNIIDPSSVTGNEDRHASVGMPVNAGTARTTAFEDETIRRVPSMSGSSMTSGSDRTSVSNRPKSRHRDDDLDSGISSDKDRGDGFGSSS